MASVLEACLGLVGTAAPRLERVGRPQWGWGSAGVPVPTPIPQKPQKKTPHPHQQPTAFLHLLSVICFCFKLTRSHCTSLWGTV